MRIKENPDQHDQENGLNFRISYMKNGPSVFDYKSDFDQQVKGTLAQKIMMSETDFDQ